MSMDTTAGTRNVLNPDRRTVPQLLAAAARDTDAASVFYNGSGPADYDSAIVVIKGRENVEYVVAMLARQQLVTPGKPVEGNAGVTAVPAWGPEGPGWKATHGCTHECRQGAQCKCDDEAKAAAGVKENLK